MLRQLRKCLWAACLGLSLQSAWAFSLLGPAAEYDDFALPAGFGDDWQVPQIGYNPLVFDEAAIGPKALGEEYRRNTRFVFYSYDLSFREYFGVNGMAAVDQAFDIMNSLTNVSSYSSALAEFPLETRQENFTAEALSLTDLKSVTLHFLIEQMGLTDPVRYTWALRERVHLDGAPACPEGQGYFVIQRNLDINPTPLNQVQYTAYVNGTLYTFQIFEDCGDGDDPDADAIEFPVDPLDFHTYSPVASSVNLGGQIALPPGFFYTGLTRDDVAGLRYLMRTNNINLESAGLNAQAMVTNAPQILTTQDLGLLAARALTNDAAGLQALYPGLADTSTPTGWMFVVDSTVSFLITFPPNAPAGTFTLTPVTNSVTNIVQTFSHTLDNVITNSFSPRSFVTTETISLTNVPGAVAGTVALRTTSRTVLTNTVAGDFFLIPPGLCAVRVLSNIFTTVIPTTTTVIATNIGGATNVNGGFFIQNTTTYFTNRTLAILPVVCPTDPIRQFQGIEKVNFVHVDDDRVDPLTGLYRIPLTNEYSMVAFNPTNHTFFPVRIRRVITQPDILFKALDITGPPDGADGGFAFARSSRGIVFNFSGVLPGLGGLPGLAGPGTIDPTRANCIIAYNKVSPGAVLSPNAYFVDLAQASMFPFLVWGSYDGTTNAPIVYPNGTSIENLETRMLTQFQPETLPFGRVGDLFQATQFTATGPQLQPPFVWSLSPGSPGLPAGLALSPSGTISGPPTEEGVFDFVIRLTDSAGHTVDRNYSITIHPPFIP